MPSNSLPNVTAGPRTPFGLPTVHVAYSGLDVGRVTGDHGTALVNRQLANVQGEIETTAAQFLSTHDKMMLELIEMLNGAIHKP